jgi:D-tyrosyl-tRNA(Tyr) deacylase
MRAVVQRVQWARVKANGAVTGEIGVGLLVFLGVGREDDSSDAAFLAEKIVNLRIFNDDLGKLNCSALDLGLPLLVVSQFTLYGDCRKGRRPSFSEAAPPETGEELYQAFCTAVGGLGLPLQTGTFRAEMLVELANDGPVTLLLDSKRRF